MRTMIAHDEKTIFGIGFTAEGALEDAQDYISTENPDTLLVTPCDSDLFTHVAVSGGDIKFVIEKGVAKLDYDEQIVTAQQERGLAEWRRECEEEYCDMPFWDWYTSWQLQKGYYCDKSDVNF